MANKLTEAFDFAYELHKNDFRKGTKAPYMVHLMGVSSLVFEYGGDENQAIAGLLHDTVEDHYAVNLTDEITTKFGYDVTLMVCHCTDWIPRFSGEKKLNWRERKQNYIAALSTFPERSGLVITADKLYNARSIVKDLRDKGEEVWKIFTGKKEGTLWYYGSITTALQNRWPKLEIVNELYRTVEIMESLTTRGAGGGIE